MVTYTVAGGCFWCIDAVFRRLKGVKTSICGYAGGSAEDAEYYQVATGKTMHAESVQVTFDESIISKDVVLGIFFLIHDPTTLNKQGADIGPQYASVLFYENDEQRDEFKSAITRAQLDWDEPIVTRVEPLDAFYEAEPEHQDYFSNNPANGYCSIVIAPKIIKARQQYTKWFKEEV